MSLRPFALAIALGCLVVSQATAAPNHGWYATVESAADWTAIDGRVTDLPLGGLLGLGPQLDDPSTADLDTGWGGFATVGTHIGPHVTIEGELGYRTGDASNTETVSQTTLMLNALYALALTDALTISAGGGIGADLINWDHISSVGPDSRDNQALFAYQGIVGLTVDLTDGVAVVAKYRYLKTSGADMPGVESEEAIIHGNDTSSQSIALGLKFGL